MPVLTAVMKHVMTKDIMLDIATAKTKFPYFALIFMSSLKKICEVTYPHGGIY